jgi:hypothetical protein
MKIRRREFMGAVGGALVPASAPAVNSAARVPEMNSQAAQPIPTMEKSYTVSAGDIAVALSSQGTSSVSL